MFRSVNFMAENVRHDKFFDESRLEDVPESIQRGNFLRLADKADDLVDVIHCGGRGYLFRLGLSSW